MTPSVLTCASSVRVRVGGKQQPGGGGTVGGSVESAERIPFDTRVRGVWKWPWVGTKYFPSNPNPLVRNVFRKLPI